MGFWRGADSRAVQICTDVSTTAGLTSHGKDPALASVRERRRSWGSSTSCRTRDTASTSSRWRLLRACRRPCRGRRGRSPVARPRQRSVSQVSSLVSSAARV